MAPGLKVKIGGKRPQQDAGPQTAPKPKAPKRTARNKRKATDDNYEYDEDAQAEIPVGAEVVGVGADDLEEMSDEETAFPYQAGPEPETYKDYSALSLKDDHSNRPLWVTPDGRIFLETYSPVYKQAYDFLIAIAEPVCRPESVHEYTLTPHSLYAAVSVGLEASTIITVLNRLSKVTLPKEIQDFIHQSTGNYGKVKLVLQRNKFFVESRFPEVLQQLSKDEIVGAARAHPDTDVFQVSKGLREQAAVDLMAVDVDEGTAGPTGDDVTADPVAGAAEALAQTADPDRDLHSFEIIPEKVESVKARCLNPAINMPMLEEYDFKNDSVNPDLQIELKPHVKLRPFQEKSMAKMFGNGRARSGIIVLPCGAGKTLVGVTASSRIRKSVLCLVTNSVSVDQWKHQFKLWSNLQDHQITRFTSEHKEPFIGASNVCITTYTMIAYTGQRSEEAARVMEQISGREWGLILLDEVHVVPAQMFRKVIGIVKAHTKLGLTATLVREDDRITDLNFLIGPKLYEANWLDLTRAGHIANVQCAEVWCPMTKEFYKEYLKPENSGRKQLLYGMNPNKFQACQFLLEYHERVRGDKVIVFSDNVFALREYATKLNRPFIYGGTGHQERTRVLYNFKHNPQVNTVFLSKVGDNSIDIPEANVLIQISSHAGSRRQEAQRLGRILRAKQTRPSNAGASTEEFNAFFYTLVSTDTQEMFYSTKRQQFLVDQGYSFKVITNLLDSAQGQQLHYSTKDAQLDLLAHVLSAGEKDVEEVDDVRDDVARTAKGLSSQRTKGNLAKMSGADGLTYMEIKSAPRSKPRQQHSKHWRAAARKPAELSSL